MSISQLVPNPIGAAVGMVGTLSSQLGAEFPGIYNLQYVTELNNSGATAGNVDIWFRKNGVDIDNSSCAYIVPPKVSAIDGRILAALSSNIRLLSSDVIEIMWHTDSTNVYLKYTGPAVSPVRPAAPSITASMNFVSSVPA